MSTILTNDIRKHLVDWIVAVSTPGKAAKADMIEQARRLGRLVETDLAKHQASLKPLVKWGYAGKANIVADRSVIPLVKDRPDTSWDAVEYDSTVLSEPVTRLSRLHYVPQFALSGVRNRTLFVAHGNTGLFTAKTIRQLSIYRRAKYYCHTQRREQIVAAVGLLRDLSTVEQLREPWIDGYMEALDFIKKRARKLSRTK